MKKNLLLLSLLSTMSAGLLAGCGDKNVSYVITFKNYNEDILETKEVAKGVLPEYTGETPLKEEYQGVKYTFVGWTPDLVPAVSDAIYYAKYDSEYIDYLITFDVNGGEGSYDSQNLHYGDKVVKPENDPSKADDDEYTYAFKYWYKNNAEVEYDFDNEIVTSNFTLTAKYEASYISYTVSFNSKGGKDVLPINVKKGGTISDLPTPDREGDAQYSYVFLGWYLDEELTQEFTSTTPVTSDITLFAKWNQVVNEYTVTFLNSDGSVIESGKYQYGTTPVCTTTPTKEEDDYCSYEFNGWDKDVVAVSEDATYIAQYNEINVKWTHHNSYPAGCGQYGLKEYWDNAHGEIVFVEPTGTISEGSETTYEDVVEIYNNNQNDSRLIPAIPHSYNSITGACEKEKNDSWTDVLYQTTGDGNGISIVNETTRVVEGYDMIYECKHTYNDGVSYHISHLFTDKLLDGVSEFEFYIDPNGIQTFFAGPDGTTSTGYQLHPHATYESDHGTIIGKQTSPKTWEISAVGLKFRRMSDGAAVSSYVFTIPEEKTNSLNTLFKNTNGWGASTIYVSNVKVKTMEHCGCYNITGSAINDLSILSKETEVATPTNYNELYKVNKSINGIFKAFPIEGYNEIRFAVVNNDENNGFVLYGNGTACAGGFWGSDEVVATKEKDTNNWTVRLQSGNKLFTINPDGETDAYTLNATTLDNLFNLWSVSSDLYITEVVAKGTSNDARLNITNTAIGKFNTSADGTSVITEGENAMQGFGKLYSYTLNYYLTDVTKPIYSPFSTTSIDEYKIIEFYMDTQGKEMFFAGDDGLANSGYEFHPGVSSTNGYIRCIQGESGTWTVEAYGFLFRQMSDGSTVSSFVFTNRHSLNDLFHRPSDKDYGASTITISDIIAYK